jgi:conjugal transfer/type IV secretion protein DotA/TraY
MASKSLSVAKFTLLPGILPRVGRLLFSGFRHLGYTIALACATLRLLPPNHPYLNPSNYGRFGIRNVMAEARKHLIFDRQHVDQIILYYTLMIGFLLVGAQIALLVASATVRGALASDIGTTLTSYFVTQTYSTDLAYRLLDMVFGFGNMFNSCVMTNSCTPAGPPRNVAFQTALQDLFHFYNVGILAVAIIIFLYMVVTVVGETAESGTPFGSRFNRAWAPFRLIWAIGMLCPLTFGMNGAQLTTMYVAKWGSSFATNSWNLFLGDLGTTTPLGDKTTLVIEPEAPTLNTMVEFLFVAKTCAWYQNMMYGKVINAYVIGQTPVSATQTVTTATLLMNGPQLNSPPNTNNGILMSFAQAAQISGYKDILIRFGEQSPDYTMYSGGPAAQSSLSLTSAPQANQFATAPGASGGGVRPICGEMTFPVKDLYQPGALNIENHYFANLGDMWQDTGFDGTAQNIVYHYIPNELRNPDAPVPAVAGDAAEDGNLSVTDFVNDSYDFYNDKIPGYITEARNLEITSGDWTDSFQNLGWMGAAIWYNKLAEMNGGFMAAVQGMPRGNKYSEVMEEVSSQRSQTDQLVDPADRFRPYEANGNPIDFSNPSDRPEAMVEYTAQQIWQDTYIQPTNSSILDVIKSVFGLQDLFSIRQNVQDGINPLAQLVGLGRGLIESGIQNLGFSFGAGVFGGLANILGMTPMHTVGIAMAKMATTVALLGLTCGFVLFYMIPFMPFIYFFFSASTWVKSIFEGLVSMPLWAISHMRIDGEGLPGPAAMNGYFLLLEIFLRPVLMIFGLVGGLSIFGAQAMILDEVWDIVTDNVTGYDYAGALNGAAATTVAGSTTGLAIGSLSGMRGIMDQFMTTIIFTITLYMMALSSFKLCDTIPDNILRWMGIQVASFGQSDPNPGDGLMEKVTVGANMFMDPQNGPLVALVSRNL